MAGAIRHGWTRTALLLLIVAAVGLAAPKLVAQQPVSGHVVPLKEFSPDQRFQRVSGDPTRSGEPYVIRIHAEPGYVIMPHTHPEDENIVVLKGTWSVGMGDRYRPEALEAMEAGTYGFVPKRMPHFAFSKTETIIQVHGTGPFTTTWVVPLYELTKSGILLSTSASLRGSPAASSPPNCFPLPLGTRVRATHGEGVVVGAECTPDQLTQYRIQTSSGDRFWAQRGDLVVADPAAARDGVARHN